MKLSKIMATSALTLVIAGTSIVTVNAAELDNLDENTENSIIAPFNLVAQYLNGSTNGGEFKTDFYIGKSGDEAGYRFNVKNNGANSFDWQITRPNGTKFAGGTLAPGKSITEEVTNYCPNMPIGTYKVTIITKDGKKGYFDFAFRVLAFN